MNKEEVLNWCAVNGIQIAGLTSYQTRAVKSPVIVDFYWTNSKYHIIKHCDKGLVQKRGSFKYLDNLDSIFAIPEASEVVEDSSPTFTAKQQLFVKRAMAGENIFLTGKAGTGKTFVVKTVIEMLKKIGRKIVALAPTGMAAVNIDGQTIHSMFALTPFGILNFEECKFFKQSKRDLLKAIDTILIDEVSMLRPDVLDAMNWTLKKNGLPGLESKQVIFIGDLAQLPTILDDNSRSVLMQSYDGDTFLHSRIINKLNPITIELDEVLRQTNEGFIHALNIVREGGKSEYFRQFVSKETKGVVLAPHNVTVQKYNEIGLAAQAGELFTFKASLEGKAKYEDFKLEQEIRVKNGCKIMYLVNSENNLLRNGTIGTFVSHKNCHFIRVGGVDYALEQVEITKKEYVYDKYADELRLVEIGKITQYPFKLAYALSIHKSQGMTFDEVSLDLTRPCFQRGQMYVALSRVRTPEGLRIII